MGWRRTGHALLSETFPLAETRDVREALAFRALMKLAFGGDAVAAVARFLSSARVHHFVECFWREEIFKGVRGASVVVVAEHSIDD
jgi:hypothetical protein